MGQEMSLPPSPYVMIMLPSYPLASVSYQAQIYVVSRQPGEAECGYRLGMTWANRQFVSHAIFCSESTTPTSHYYHNVLDNVHAQYVLRFEKIDGGDIMPFLRYDDSPYRHVNATSAPCVKLEKIQFVEAVAT
jgi:hypothetical protein